MAVLSDYQAQVVSLLDDAGNVEYTLTDLDAYINEARVQIAGASESLRQPATLALAAGTQSYRFSSAAVAAGLGGLLDVRMAALVGGNQLEMRSWEYFFSYYLAVPSPASGTPTVMAQLVPGVNGTLWFAPIPNAAITVMLDAVCYPILLVNDSTFEALSYPWTEAVQYYAAYLAYLNAQRRTDADAMFARYQTWETRATQISTPSRLSKNFIGGVGARMAGQHMPLTAIEGGQRRGGG